MARREENRGAQHAGVYMISVAASMAGVHPQTLRIYEQRRLITPQRTPKGTRLYSDENVERLRRIQQLTDEGMNLAGVERVFDMEAQIARMSRRIASLERQLLQAREEALAEIERVRRANRAEVVLYRKPPTGLAPREAVQPPPARPAPPARPSPTPAPTRIPVRRPEDSEE